MADLSSLKSLGKPLAVLGLGISGKAVVEALHQAGVPFDAWDDNAERREQFSKYSVREFFANLEDYAALIPAAGIKPSHPILKKAAEKNIPILSDIDLLIKSAPDARVIGITGTNGKSTTTALIGHVLEANHANYAVGGNIGRAACSLPSLDQTGVYVLELSSYQLEITAEPVCDIAVFLNFAPDHIDWHENEDNYFNAKKKITIERRNRQKQKTVIGIDTPRTGQLAMQLALSDHHEVITVSTNSAAMISVKNNHLYDGDEAIVDLSTHVHLKGQHNFENIAAAYAALRAFGMARERIIPHLMTYEGLPYRQKQVGQWRNIVFINDSKATNADATRRALASFDHIYWIAGGLAKSDGIDNLEEFYPRIRHAFLIGDASKRFADKLKGQLPYTECGTLANAVYEAFALAKSKNDPATILLSPACASFDQYKNFEQRGDDFTSQVEAIIQKAGA